MFIGYVKPANLLSTENAKTVKGEKKATLHTLCI